MRALAAAALIAVALGVAGCGGVGVSGASSTIGNQLTVYSSLPLQGPSGANSQQIVDGEKLALSEAGGRIGAFKISYLSMDDSNPASGEWDPGVTATNAKTAAEDTSTIAYLGDYNSGASAVSLPLINASGILQVSPSSPYVGLTSSLDAGQDEPERFYPSGKRTFGRLQPGDPAQAEAQVKLMRGLGVRRLYVLDDEGPFQVPLSELVASDARRAGIAVAAHDSLDMTHTNAGTSFESEVAKVAESGAGAVFFAGGTGTGTVALWKQLHDADPKLLLLGSSDMVNKEFISEIGAAAGASTYLTTPILPVGLYPPAAGRVLASYRRRFGRQGDAYTLYGYEAMSVALLSIRRAGVRGNDRQAVVDQFFAIRDRDSAIGRYSMRADGETTLSSYGSDRVKDGRAVFYKVLPVR
ncbi:MAG: branched-chain amino acid ABC transporter substrate-binding protein [Solirubrobacteraceae bacterium]